MKIVYGHKPNAMDTEHFFRISLILMALWTTAFAAPTREDILTLYQEAIDHYYSKIWNTFPEFRQYPGHEKYTQFSLARSVLFPLSNVEPILPGFGSVINDVTSFQYPISIPPCSAATLRTLRFIFIAVISSAENFQKRFIIRKTWAKNLRKMWAKHYTHLEGFAFILGRAESSVIQNKIVYESNIYKDIIQMDIPHQFNGNLMMKDAGLLNWLSKNCFVNCTDNKMDEYIRNSYILKVNDDVYVNVRNLQYFLHNGVSTRNLDNPWIYGRFLPYRHPHDVPDTFRDPENSIHIPYNEWPWSNFPTYLSGSAIVLNKNAVRPLLAAIQTTPVMSKEDVYLNGICASKANASIQTPYAPVRVFDFETPHPGCQVRGIVSWVTDNMEESHKLTENFYKDVERRCYVLQPNGGEILVTYDNDPL